MTALGHGLRVAGDSNVGKVRSTNEDAMIIEPRTGLYAVLDGMGGANAGDVASQLARDTIRDFVHSRNKTLPPRQLLEAAIIAGSAAAFNPAQKNPHRHRLGTTVVARLILHPGHVAGGHGGASPPGHLRGR